MLIHRFEPALLLQSTGLSRQWP